jgi:hypothetical protein
MITNDQRDRSKHNFCGHSRFYADSAGVAVAAFARADSAGAVVVVMLSSRTGCVRSGASSGRRLSFRFTVSRRPVTVPPGRSIGPSSMNLRYRTHAMQCRVYLPPWGNCWRKFFFFWPIHRREDANRPKRSSTRPERCRQRSG